MPLVPAHLKPRPALGLLAAVALVGAAGPAGAAGRPDTGPAGPHRTSERLVVRGDATAVAGPCDARVCHVALADGRFRGTPVGAGAYTGAIRLRVGDAFPNGEGGICAPLRARLVLGAGSRDRLAVAVSGDSCQDGGGPLPGASFTGLARFTVDHGTGRYAGATGRGRVSLTEDAAHHHRITLIGRLVR
jgi:hypothetical protein